MKYPTEKGIINLCYQGAGYGVERDILPANIDKARIKNRKIGEEMDRKHKVQTVSNTSINLDYM